MMSKEELINALIIQYENSIRLKKKLLDCGFAEALLSIIPIYSNNQEALEALLNKTFNEGERLKKCLETARDKVSELFVKQEENTYIKKFLDFAFSLSMIRDSDEDIDIESNSEEQNSFQNYDVSLKDNIFEESKKSNVGNEQESVGVWLQSDEIVDECRSLKLTPNFINEDIISKYNSTLKLAQELLNIQILQRKGKQNEREKSGYLTENLFGLLQKYNKRICDFVETNETDTSTSSNGDHSNMKEKYNSDSFCEENTSQPDDHNSENNFYTQYNYNSPICHPSSFQDGNTPEKSINSILKLSTGKEQYSDLANEISNQLLQKPTSTPTDLFDSTITPYKDLFECDTCGRCFLKKKNIILHVREHMKKIQSFHCTKCGKIFLMKKIEEKLLKCPVCDTHANENNSEGKNKLPIAALEKERNYKSRQKIVDFSGKRRSEISNVCCDICGGEYSNKYVLQTHIRQVHRKEKPYQCTECGKRFGTNSYLKKHILIHNGTSQKMDNYSKISRTEISHFCCNLCNRKFSNRRNLSRHFKYMHVENKPHECIECGKGFAYNSRLKRHASVHESQKLYKCSVCNTDFKHHSSKKTHERILHEGGAHFQCAHCDKKLSSRSTLISHIHTKHFSAFQKQFMCTICNKSFALKYQLQNHKLTHTSLKPLKCSVCSEYFKHHCSRNAHEKKFHPEVFRFRCEHCDKRYWSKTNLIIHLQNKCKMI